MAEFWLLVDVDPWDGVQIFVVGNGWRGDRGRAMFPESIISTGIKQADMRAINKMGSNRRQCDELKDQDIFDIRRLKRGQRSIQ